jgi:hypothetical protein
MPAPTHWRMFSAARLSSIGWLRNIWSVLFD